VNFVFIFLFDGSDRDFEIAFRECHSNFLLETASSGEKDAICGNELKFCGMSNRNYRLWFVCIDAQTRKETLYCLKSYTESIHIRI
jgi:hypothetical protein